jgi:transposase-like protein
MSLGTGQCTEIWGQVIGCAVLIAVLIAAGIGLDGKRSILGGSPALSEAEVHWRTFLASLQEPGLSGIQLIVSDDHAGLV